MDDENVSPTPEEPVAPAAPEMPVEPPAAPEEPAAVAPEPEVPPAYEPPAPPAPPVPPAPAAGYTPPPAAAPVVSGDKNKVVAGVLAILLGSLGIHKFYLGYTKEGIILIAVTFISFGMLAWVTWIVGVIEGILYITKTDQEFYATYVVGRKPWF